MKKTSKRIFRSSVAVVFTLILAPVCGLPAAAQQTLTQPQVLSNALVNKPTQFDVSRPLAEQDLATDRLRGASKYLASPTVRAYHLRVPPIQIRNLVQCQEKSRVGTKLKAIQKV